MIRSIKKTDLPDLDHVILQSGPVWESLRGARLFITGGTGVFGTWLLESLMMANRERGLGLRAVVLTRDPNSYCSRHPHLANLPSLVFHPGDVRKFAHPGGSFSHLIHAATTSSVHPEQIRPREMFETILEGTHRTLEFARQTGVHRYLLVSSGAVYGRQPSDCSHVAEDDIFGPDPLDPASAYSEGKRAAELLCAVAHKADGIETTVARCFTVVGPMVPLDLHFAVGNFLHDALAGGPVHVRGDGTPIRSYLHMADLAVWFWTILVLGRPGRAYNVGSDQPISIAELAHKVASLVGTKVVIARKAVPGQPASRYVPSIQRAYEELGLKVRIDLNDALRRTMMWLRKGVFVDGIETPPILTT